MYRTGLKTYPSSFILFPPTFLPTRTCAKDSKFHGDAFWLANSKHAVGKISDFVAYIFEFDATIFSQLEVLLVLYSETSTECNRVKNGPSQED